LLGLRFESESHLGVHIEEGWQLLNPVSTYDVVGAARQANVPDGWMNGYRSAVEVEAPTIRIKVQENFLRASARAEVDDSPVLRGDVHGTELQSVRSGVDELIGDFGSLGHHD